MQVEAVPIIKMLEPNRCYKVPIYQRKYNWGREHCKTLYDDIVNIGKDESNLEHFLGSITCVTESNSLYVSKFQIIDGQQRLTTIMLLICALKQSNSSIKDDVFDQLLFNRPYPDDNYSLILGKSDDKTFKNILLNKSLEESNNIADNYNYFKKLLSSDIDYEKIWRGIGKLTVVNVTINDKSDAQKIFESMNSTGLDLSETDMIKNYILMPYNESKQTQMYEHYWEPMEQKFQEHDDDTFDEFLRMYLMMMSKKPISKKCVYSSFKKYVMELDKEDVIKSIFEYSQYYSNIIMISPHSSSRLNKIIKYIYDQNASTAHSFLLKVLGDYQSEIIDEDKAVAIFKLIDSYLLRCRVCETGRDSNKTFPELIGKIKNDDYANSIENALMLKTGVRWFPRDIEFRDKLKDLRLYSNQNLCRYILDRLEPDSKEKVPADDLQIEHIMPKTLSKEWENDLGNNHKEIHEKYLNTIGNLTLTGNNQKLSNSRFIEKCAIYRHSNIQLTRALAEYSDWSDKRIIARAEFLTNRALKLWECPKEPKSICEDMNYNDEYEYDYLEDRNVSELWEILKKEILTIKDLEFHMWKHYGTFRLNIQNNSVGICSIEAHNHQIYLIYNTKIQDEVVKPSKSIDDISQVGHYGTGDLRSIIRSIDDIAESIKHLKAICEYKSAKKINK